MKETVEHSGVVIRKSFGILTVRLQESQEQCDGCAIAGMCGSKSDSVIDVPVEDSSEYEQGARVIVSARPSTTLTASLFVFFVPCVILIAVVLALSLNGVKEITGIMIGLGVMVVYDAIAYTFFKTKLNGVIKWNVRKLR